MSFRRGYFAAWVVAAWAAASIAVGVMAAADPVWPVAGNGTAADTIRELQDQGYTVAINGSITAPLERCLVTAIHNPDRSRRQARPIHDRLRRRVVPAGSRLRLRRRGGRRSRDRLLKIRPLHVAKPNIA